MRFSVSVQGTATGELTAVAGSRREVVLETGATGSLQEERRSVEGLRSGGFDCGESTNSNVDAISLVAAGEDMVAKVLQLSLRTVSSNSAHFIDGVGIKSCTVCLLYLGCLGQRKDSRDTKFGPPANFSVSERQLRD